MKRSTLITKLITEDPRELAARYVAAVRRRMDWSNNNKTTRDNDPYWKLTANSTIIEEIGLYLHGVHFVYAVRSFPNWDGYSEHDSDGLNLFDRIEASYSKEA